MEKIDSVFTEEINDKMIYAMVYANDVDTYARKHDLYNNKEFQDFRDCIVAIATREL